MLQHKEDSKEMLVADPFLSKTCFALEQALNPPFRLLQVESQLGKEQQRVFQSSLFWLLLLQQLKVPPPCSALAAPAARPPTTVTQPISKRMILTAQGTGTAQPEGDTIVPRRHLVGEEQPPSTSHNCPPLTNDPDAAAAWLGCGGLMS